MSRYAQLGARDITMEAKRLATLIALQTGAAGPHNILSPTHNDATTTAATRGDIIIADSVPVWTALNLGAAYSHLESDGTDIAWQVNITLADDAWIGLGAAGGRLIFDSTPAPDEIILTSANFDLNDNDLIFDSDGDSYIHAEGDDHVELVLATASGQFDININGADDFTFTANSFNVLSSSYITMADDTWIGLGAAAGRLVFDSTPATDEIRVETANLDLNNNDLILDTDGDSYLHAEADDHAEFVLATASGQLDININGADDFTFTADSFNVLASSTIAMADGTTIGQAAGPLLTFDDAANSLELSGGDLHLYSGADLIIYSDAGATEVGRWDGATGNYTSSGNITITQDGTLASIAAYCYGVDGTKFPTFRGRSARTSLASPAAVQDGDILCRVGGAGYGSTGFATANRSFLQFEASQTWTDANQGAEFYFYTTPDDDTTAVNRGVIAQDGKWGIGNLSAPSTLLHVYTSDSDTTVRIETDKADGQPTIQFLNDARQWNVGVNSSDNFQIRDATAPANRLIIDTSGNVGIGVIPNSLMEWNFATENLEFVDAGSAGATEQDWIQVEVGGNTGYIRVFAAV